MSAETRCFILFLMALSLLLFLLDVWVLCRHLARRKGSSLSRKLYLPTILLLLCVFLLRHAVGLYRISTGATELQFGEEIFNTLIHTPQSFSLDGDYTRYLLDGKAFLMATFRSGIPAGLYGAYASIVNLCAPIGRAPETRQAPCSIILT